MKIDLTRLVTESRNPASEQIDTLSTLDMLQVINQQDQLVALAVAQTLPQVAQAVEAITAAFAQGGRLIYMGAGTSGRLGILDASECPPTYGSKPEQVIGLIAGGHTAILKAVENAEDNRELGQSDLKSLNLNEKDVLVGIAASGRTPYVIAGMEYARSVGATVVSLACNPAADGSVRRYCDYPRSRCGSGYGLVTHESGHCAETGAQYADHGRDDQKWQSVWQPDGGCGSDQRQAHPTANQHCSGSDRRKR